MSHEFDLTTPDGRTLHVHDTVPGTSGQVVFWHHGTPNTGRPPAPLLQASEQLGLRWVSFDRPGYGRSSPHPGRTVASVATDLQHLADHLNLDRFWLMGHSGGGTFALGAAALLQERVAATVSMAGLAPFDSPGLDWFAGMYEGGRHSLQAAAQGSDAKTLYEAADPPYDPEMFTEHDHQALEGPWSWLNTVVQEALQAGPAPLIDDDLAYVTPWGVDLSNLKSPVLLVHGQEDRVVPATHSQWLHGHLADSELWLLEGEGHLSILNHAEKALEWLACQD